LGRDKKKTTTPIDFLWIDKKEGELFVLNSLQPYLPGVRVIYTSTHLSKTTSSHYIKLDHFLEKQNFRMLSHWYTEGDSGNAIFLHKAVFDASMRSLNYAGTENSTSLSSIPNNLERALSKADNKNFSTSIPEIDFIYMINLDERPEKFELSLSNLAPYGIYPYRFSAVNGWKLPFTYFGDIGTKLTTNPTPHQFMGTVFREESGGIYKSQEFLHEANVPYFALGMSHGVVGIVLSHLSVLKDGYDSGYKTIWVMEDDIEVTEDPRQLSTVIQNLDLLDPDWDILFTDVDSKDREGAPAPCRSLAMRPNFPIKPLSYYLDNFYPISEDLSRTGMRYGAYSMIIRRSGIEKILHYYKAHSVYLPYDMDFWLIPEIRMYTVNKPIVSTISNALSDNQAPNYSSEPKSIAEETH
jgi:GR25 family glycosyltransferase involved in LPS biosynthesis